MQKSEKQVCGVGYGELECKNCFGHAKLEVIIKYSSRKVELATGYKNLTLKE